MLRTTSKGGTLNLFHLSIDSHYGCFKPDGTIIRQGGVPLAYQLLVINPYDIGLIDRYRDENNAYFYIHPIWSYIYTSINAYVYTSAYVAL
jgi:hypothetical protein